MLKATRTEQDNPIIVGGDFNIILDPDLDGRGRKGMHNVRASEPCEACEPCEADTRGMQKMRGTSRGTGNT